MAEAPTGPVYLPRFTEALADSVVLNKRSKSPVTAAGGKIVYADNKRTRTQWADLEMAAWAAEQERGVRRRRRVVTSFTNELKAAKAGLAIDVAALKETCRQRDRSGHSNMRLDQLRAWAEEHMPSVLAAATDGGLLYLRFCAAAMRGAGRKAGSPNRFLIPAMWVVISIDTGRVMEARSDGNTEGAFHPHTRESSGEVCTGSAVRSETRSRPMPLSTLKTILAEIEVWRLYYGDDFYEHPRNMARKVWGAARTGAVSFAPVQGTTGRVYRDLDTLLRAEPWDGSASPDWCGEHDTPFTTCGCCAACGEIDGTCRCGNCPSCGRDRPDCNCCIWCENNMGTWVYRGATNEHQLCGVCGYCRHCDTTDLSETAGLREPGWGSVLWFLTETDAKRVQALATIEYGRRSVQPPDYSASCDCSSCRPHTEFLNNR